MTLSRADTPRTPVPVVRLLCACFLLATAVGAAAAPADERAAIADLRHDGRTEEALAACRAYNRDHPGEPTMLYNQACLEALSADPAGALATLREALAAGFDDLDHAATDPDLAALAAEPAFRALLTEHAAAMLLLSRERGFELAPETWSEPRTLEPSTPGPVSGAARLSLRWQPAGLEIALAADGIWASLVAPDTPSPLAGGPALTVTLGVPDAARPWLSDNAFVFLFGAGDSGGLGAVWLPTADRWQPVVELAPKLRPGDGGRLDLTVTIPWAAIMPYHPLVDAPLGFNAALRVPGAAAALLPDPRAFAPRAGSRRIARLDLPGDLVAGEVFLGRVDRSLVPGEPLGFELVAVSPGGGLGRLAVDFLDATGRSVLPEGSRTVPLDLQPGLQRLRRGADFSGLKAGTYLLRAELAFPSGHEAVWSTRILNLPPGWRDELLAGIAGLDEADRPTAEYLLEAIDAALADHRRRRDPGPIATTLSELAAMLERAAATGSILPDDGGTLLVFPGPRGQTRLCTVFRPPARDGQTGERPVLVLNNAAGFEGRIAERIARFYEYGSLDGAGTVRPLYLVPHLPATVRGAAAAADEARAAATWAAGRFGAGPVDLAGIDFGAGPALRLATGMEPAPERLLVLAGAALEPWPEADEAALAGHLAQLPPALAITWADFALETANGGQGRELLRALAARGATLARQDVRGALSLSQACDRIVLWAEGLQAAGAR